MITSRSFGLGLRVLAVGSAAAHAQAEPEVALDYRAPESCPDRAYFVAKLADRGGRLHGEESAARVDRLEVAIEQTSDSTYAGRWTLYGPASRHEDGRSTEAQLGQALLRLQGPRPWVPVRGSRRACSSEPYGEQALAGSRSAQ